MTKTHHRKSSAWTDERRAKCALRFAKLRAAAEKDGTARVWKRGPKTNAEILTGSIAKSSQSRVDRIPVSLAMGMYYLGGALHGRSESRETAWRRPRENPCRP